MEYPDQKWTRDEVRSRIDNTRWSKIRKEFLSRFPYCVYCARRGLKVLATDVDHKTPKRCTNEDMWYDKRNLQSLCKHCHDTSKYEEEVNGYSHEIGFDGFPIDSRHPVNSKDKGKVLSLEEFRRMSDD